MHEEKIFSYTRKFKTNNFIKFGMCSNLGSLFQVRYFYHNLLKLSKVLQIIELKHHKSREIINNRQLKRYLFLQFDFVWRNYLSKIFLNFQIPSPFSGLQNIVNKMTMHLSKFSCSGEKRAVLFVCDQFLMNYWCPVDMVKKNACKLEYEV